MTKSSLSKQIVSSRQLTLNEQEALQNTADLLDGMRDLLIDLLMETPTTLQSRLRKRVARSLMTDLDGIKPSIDLMTHSAPVLSGRIAEDDDLTTYDGSLMR